MKLIRIFLLVLILIGTVLILAQKIWVPKLVHIILSNEQIPLAQKIPEQIRIPFDFSDYFKVGIKDGFIVDNKNISFKILTDPEFQSRNPTLDVYVDNTKVGRVTAQGIRSFGISPDNRYIVLSGRNTMGCVGMCQSFFVFAIDLAKLSIINLKLPDSNKNFFVDRSKYQDVTKFIESAKWIDTETIQFTTFYVGLDKDGLYRITNKENINYNFNK